jgi:hypothetical protein
MLFVVTPIHKEEDIVAVDATVDSALNGAKPVIAYWTSPTEKAVCSRRSGNALTHDKAGFLGRGPCSDLQGLFRFQPDHTPLPSEHGSEGA